MLEKISYSNVRWRCTNSGAEFSWSAAFLEDLDLVFFPNIWILGGQSCWGRRRSPTYIELPSLYMLARFFAGDDDNQFGNFTTIHPLLELRHDFLDVSLDLVVGGY